MKKLTKQTPEDRLIGETIKTALEGAELLESQAEGGPKSAELREMAEAIRMLAAAVAGLTHTAV